MRSCYFCVSHGEVAIFYYLTVFLLFITPFSFPLIWTAESSLTGAQQRGLLSHAVSLPALGEMALICLGQ